jgi:hypothetical protein
VGLALLLTACGGSTTDEPGGDGAGTGGTAGRVGTGGSVSAGGAGGTSSSGGMGAGCGLVAESAPPLSVTLRFSNSGPSPLWLWIECLLDCELTSCGDQYAAPLTISAGCGTGDCSIATGCDVPFCGVCPFQGQMVSAGGYHDFAWGGQTYTFGTNLSGCSCYVAHDVPAGFYRVSVPVWTADPGMVRTMPTYTTVQDFSLYRAGEIIEVRLVR